MKLYNKASLYDVEQAVDYCLQSAKAKFDETIEVAIRLGVDPRHADQQVRGTVVLPHGTGKTGEGFGVRQGRQGSRSGSRRRGITWARRAGAEKIQQEKLV